jgi:hypothetical protein
MQSWSGLHDKTNNNKFDLLQTILKEQNKTNCDCYPSSIQYLQEMLCISKNNNDSFEIQMEKIKEKFDLLNDHQFFFHHYHNLVNLKLKKDIFSLPN